MTSPLLLNLHERAVVRALRAFFDADDALSLVAWSLELGYAWREMCEERRRWRVDAWKESLSLRTLYAMPFGSNPGYGFDYRSIVIE